MVASFAIACASWFSWAGVDQFDPGASALLLGYCAVPVPSFCIEGIKGAGGIGVDPVYMPVRLLGISAIMLPTPVASPTAIAGTTCGVVLVQLFCPPGPVQELYVLLGAMPVLLAGLPLL